MKKLTTYKKSPCSVFRNEIYVLNLKNSGSHQEAKSRQWAFITRLEKGVYAPSIIHSKDKLLVVGRGHRTDVQYLNLTSNTTGIYADTINHGVNDAGVYHPGIYNIAGGNVSIFGGGQALESCIQQTVTVTELESTWKCWSRSESALEGLEEISKNIRSSNFLLLLTDALANTVKEQPVLPVQPTTMKSAVHAIPVTC